MYALNIVPYLYNNNDDDGDGHEIKKLGYYNNDVDVENGAEVLATRMQKIWINHVLLKGVWSLQFCYICGFLKKIKIAELYWCKIAIYY